jgi:hypothetical protein
MSRYFECDGVTLWNPATGRAKRFLDALRSLESDAGEPSGFGPMVSDECQIDSRQLNRFARMLATSTHPDTCSEAVTVVLALADRAGLAASWPPPLNKWEAEHLARARELLLSMPT